MPAPPRFKSEFTQKTAIAVVMAFVFAGSVALAQWITVTGGNPRPELAPLDVPEQSGDRHQIRLRAPVGWQRNPEADSLFARRTGMDVTAIYTDPDRPARQLLLAQTRLRNVTAPQLVAQQALQTLSHPSVRGSFSNLDILPINQSPLLGVWLRAISSVAGQNAAQLHDVSAITLDGYNYSLVYLTDRISKPTELETQLASNKQLVASLLGAVTTEQSP